MTTPTKTKQTTTRKKTPSKQQTPTEAVAEESSKRLDSPAIEPTKALNRILTKASAEDVLKTDIEELAKAIEFDQLGELNRTTFDATVELFSRRIDGIDKAIRELESGIKDKERSATVEYWHLGKLLLHKRETFRGGPKGAWGEWLEARGIERTKSQRARDIAAGYDSPDDVKGMTIHQALDKLKPESEREPDESDLGPRGQIVQKLSSWEKWLLSDSTDKLLKKVEQKDRIVQALDEHIAKVTDFKEALAKQLGGTTDLAGASAETIDVVVPAGK